MLFSEEPPPPSSSSQHISASIEETSIATCQKALYDFHERHHSDKPVIDIYSLRWQNRLTAWYPLYAHAHAQSCLLVARQQCKVVGKTKKHSRLNYNTTTTATSLPPQQQQQLRAEDFDLRVLFFTHPVQAFALWGVLRTFYALDAAVCGWASSSFSSSSSHFRDEKLVSRINGDGGGGVGTGHDWQAMKPLEYLTSTDVKRAWRVALETLNDDIRSERLRGCDLERRICGIYVGVEGVEERVAELVGDCAKVGTGGGFGYVLEVVQRVMDERCLMIDEILGAEEANEMTDEAQEDEKVVCMMVTA